MTEPVEIYVLGKQVKLLQPTDGFRTALDSVMLAAACPVETDEHILDIGCGVGGAGFCVLQRVPGAKLTGVEIQADHAEIAERNAELNDRQGQAEFVCADVRNYRGGLFDHVICNPPYMEEGAHMPSPKEKKAIAHGQDMKVEEWVESGFRNLKSNGSLTIIHRADMVDKIIQAMGKRFGAIEIIPLWPRQGEDAKRVIVRAIKDRKSQARLRAGIILHQENGEYTEAAEKILRGGEDIS